jgi:hypothetical protein
MMGFYLWIIFIHLYLGVVLLLLRHYKFEARNRTESFLLSLFLGMWVPFLSACVGAIAVGTILSLPLLLLSSKARKYFFRRYRDSTSVRKL